MVRKGLNAAPSKEKVFIMQKSKSKVPLIVILIVVVVGFFFLSQTSLLGSILSGVFVIGVSPVDYVSNDPTIGGPAWLVTLVQNGAGQRVVGTFDGTQIRDAEAASQFPLTIEANLISNQQVWSINQVTGQSVDDISVDQQATTFPVFSYDDRRSNCQASGGRFYPESATGYGFAHDGTYTLCVKYVNARPHGVFNSQSTYSFQTQLTSNANGVTRTATISNGQTSVQLGNEVYASWVGSLVSGTTISTPSDIVLTWDPNAARWLLTDSTTWNNYYTYRQSGISSCWHTRDLLDFNQDEINQCRNEYNGIKQDALQTRTLSVSGGDTAYTQGSISSGQVILPLSQQLQFPVLSLRIRASYIGVQVFTGIPDITSSPTSVDLRSGFTSNMVVSVRNAGTGQGSFAANAVCTSPVSFSGGAINLPTLAPSASTTVYMPITASTGSAVTSTCDITVYDRNNPSSLDTVRYTINVAPITVCNPGEKVCNGNNVMQCNSAGTQFTILQACNPATQVCMQSGSDAFCQDIGGGSMPPPSGEIPWGYVVLILGIVGAAALILTKKKKKGRR